MLTHSLTHSLTRARTHARTHALFTHSLTHPLVEREPSVKDRSRESEPKGKVSDCSLSLPRRTNVELVRLGRLNAFLLPISVVVVVFFFCVTFRFRRTALVCLPSADSTSFRVPTVGRLNDVILFDSVHE